MGIFQSKESVQQTGAGGRKRYKDYDIKNYLKKDNSDFSEFEQMKNQLMKQFGGADKNIEDADFDDFIQALQNSTEINIQAGGKKNNNDSSSISSISFDSKSSSSSSSSDTSNTSDVSKISGLTVDKQTSSANLGGNMHPEKYSNTDINVMPFYSSSESPNQHPYIKSRFKN